MEAVLCIKNARTPRVGASEFDHSLDAFGSGAGEEGFGETPAGAGAKLFGEFSRKARDMTLQHGRARCIQLLLQRSDEARVIVADVVNAIAGVEVEDAPTVGRVQLCAFAARILDVHLQYVEQSRPLGVDVALISLNAALNFLQHE